MADKTKRSSEQIRKEIDATRSEMDSTVDALEDKFSPGQLLDQVTGMFGGSGGTTSSVTRTLRDNPVPAVLIGTGLAWMTIDSLTGHDDEESYRLRARYGRSGAHLDEYGEPYYAEYSSELDERHTESKPERAKEKLSDAGDSMKHGWESAKESVSDGAESAKNKMKSGTSSARESLSDAGESMHHTADRIRRKSRRGVRQARLGFWQAMEENPLVVGAAAMAVGLIAGLTVPTTEWEDETMGEVSDQLKHEAKETASEVAEKSKRVAREAASEAKREADRQGVGASHMADKVKEVARSAKDAAKETAREENLTPERAKERAKEAKKNVSDEARR